MRKLIYAINLSLDGCYDHAKSTPGEDVHDFFTGLIQDSDIALYGRITYELMVPFWPDMAKNNSGDSKALNNFAKAFDAIDKVVVSRTLEHVEDKKTTILRGDDLHGEILKLKSESGKDIFVGGVDLPTQLIELDLVDEFIFMIHPEIVGEGKRLFDTTQFTETPELKLVETKTFKTGSVMLRYAKE